MNGVQDLKICRLQDASDPNVLGLVSKSDDYLNALYPPESNHAESLEMLTGEGSRFFIAYLGEDLVGCGAVKIFRDVAMHDASHERTYGEIKRVFVAQEHRGKHIATALMQHLEDALIDLDIQTVRLEAGPLQPAAIELYRKMGYAVRGPFGAYNDDPLSIFMEKNLQE